MGTPEVLSAFRDLEPLAQDARLARVRNMTDDQLGALAEDVSRQDGLPEALKERVFLDLLQSRFQELETRLQAGDEKTIAVSNAREQLSQLNAKLPVPSIPLNTVLPTIIDRTVGVLDGTMDRIVPEQWEWSRETKRLVGASVATAGVATVVWGMYKVGKWMFGRAQETVQAVRDATGSVGEAASAWTNFWAKTYAVLGIGLGVAVLGGGWYMYRQLEDMREEIANAPERARARLEQEYNELMERMRVEGDTPELRRRIDDLRRRLYGPPDPSPDVTSPDPPREDADETIRENRERLYRVSAPGILRLYGDFTDGADGKPVPENLKISVFDRQAHAFLARVLHEMEDMPIRDVKALAQGQGSEEERATRLADRFDLLTSAPADSVSMRKGVCLFVLKLFNHHLPRMQDVHTRMIGSSQNNFSRFPATFDDMKCGEALDLVTDASMDVVGDMVEGMSVTELAWDTTVGRFTGFGSSFADKFSERVGTSFARFEERVTAVADREILDVVSVLPADLQAGFKPEEFRVFMQDILKQKGARPWQEVRDEMASATGTDEKVLTAVLSRMESEVFNPQDPVLMEACDQDSRVITAFMACSSKVSASDALQLFYIRQRAEVGGGFAGSYVLKAKVIDILRKNSSAQEFAYASNQLLFNAAKGATEGLAHNGIEYVMEGELNLPEPTLRFYRMIHREVRHGAGQSFDAALGFVETTPGMLGAGATAVTLGMYGFSRFRWKPIETLASPLTGVKEAMRRYGVTEDVAKMISQRALAATSSRGGVHGGIEGIYHNWRERYAHVTSANRDINELVASSRNTNVTLTPSTAPSVAPPAAVDDLVRVRQRLGDVFFNSAEQLRLARRAEASAQAALGSATAGTAEHTAAQAVLTKANEAVRVADANFTAANQAFNGIDAASSLDDIAKAADAMEDLTKNTAQALSGVIPESTAAPQVLDDFARLVDDAAEIAARSYASLNSARAKVQQLESALSAAAQGSDEAVRLGGQLTTARDVLLKTESAHTAAMNTFNRSVGAAGSIDDLAASLYAAEQAAGTTDDSMRLMLKGLETGADAAESTMSAAGLAARAERLDRLAALLRSQGSGLADQAALLAREAGARAALVFEDAHHALNAGRSAVPATQLSRMGKTLRVLRGLSYAAAPADFLLTAYFSYDFIYNEYPYLRAEYEATNDPGKRAHIEQKIQHKVAVLGINAVGGVLMLTPFWPAGLGLVIVGTVSDFTVGYLHEGTEYLQQTQEDMQRMPAGQILYQVSRSGSVSGLNWASDLFVDPVAYGGVRETGYAAYFLESALSNNPPITPSDLSPAHWKLVLGSTAEADVAASAPGYTLQTAPAPILLQLIKTDAQRMRLDGMIKNANHDYQQKFLQAAVMYVRKKTNRTFDFSANPAMLREAETYARLCSNEWRSRFISATLHYYVPGDLSHAYAVMRPVIIADASSFQGNDPESEKRWKQVQGEVSQMQGKLNDYWAQSLVQIDTPEHRASGQHAESLTVLMGDALKHDMALAEQKIMSMSGTYSPWRSAPHLQSIARYVYMSRMRDEIAQATSSSIAMTPAIARQFLEKMRGILQEDPAAVAADFVANRAAEEGAASRLMSTVPFSSFGLMEFMRRNPIVSEPITAVQTGVSEDKADAEAVDIERAAHQGVNGSILKTKGSHVWLSHTQGYYIALVDANGRYMAGNIRHIASPRFNLAPGKYVFWRPGAQPWVSLTSGIEPMDFVLDVQNAG